MFREMLKSKIQKAKITNTILHYNGSIGIDKNILKKSNILPGEKVMVLNYNNADRFETYTLEEPAESGNIVLYGPAAKRGKIGENICILSFAFLENSENINPIITYLDENNKIKQKGC